MRFRLRHRHVRGRGITPLLVAAVLDAYPTTPGSPAHQGMDVINAVAAGTRDGHH
jgi:hypothetical protein